jgi:hypothetical protein
MFTTAVQEEEKTDLWSVLGGVAAFVLLIVGGYFIVL